MAYVALDFARGVTGEIGKSELLSEGRGRSLVQCFAHTSNTVTYRDAMSEEPGRIDAVTPRTASLEGVARGPLQTPRSAASSIVPTR